MQYHNSRIFQKLSEISRILFENGFVWLSCDYDKDHNRLKRTDYNINKKQTYNH